MNSFAAFIAPVALMLPYTVGGPRDAAPAADEAHVADRNGGDLSAVGFRASTPEPFRALEEAHRPPVLRQMRIEQRVIIRIAPSRPGAHDRMLPSASRPFSQLAEQKLDGCVPIEGIAAVQPTRENRLLLFMRDRRVLSAALERSCNAADFYSGFYIERSEDGALCSKRDRLQSRAGASCQVTQLSRIVAKREGG